MTLIKDRRSIHLVRIAWFQIGILILGTIAWMFKTHSAALVFAMTGITSILFWHSHVWIVARLLNPIVKLRFAFGLLIVVKLALLILLLRGIIKYFPIEVLPFATGVMLFSASIIIEAIHLILQSRSSINRDS